MNEVEGKARWVEPASSFLWFHDPHCKALDRQGSGKGGWNTRDLHIFASPLIDLFRGVFWLHCFFVLEIKEG